MADTKSPLEHNIKPEDKKKAEEITKQLQAGESYKQVQDYYDKWKEYQRFWESDQWSAVTPKTKDYPRPVTNHYKEIIEMKIAGLTYEPPETYFEPRKGSLKSKHKIDCQPINEEDEPFQITPSELLAVANAHVGEVNDIGYLIESICRSAALLCNGILYCYWDNSIGSHIGDGAYIGEIVTMEVDIADFFPGDPSEPLVQKQPYIIITERRPVNQVKEDYRQFSDSVDFIEAEESKQKQTYKHEKHEHQETGYVDLIHHWEKVVEDEEVDWDGIKLKRTNVQINYTVVCQDYIIREQEDCIKSKLYPFANFAWYPRRKSFFGIPEAADLIANQKELNRLQGIALMGAYKTGLPNVVYNANFVKREDIPIGPGGNIIKDETPPGQGRSIDYLQPPTIASYIPLLKDSMSQGMRDTSGVHEAWSGKAPSAHLNASAIMALQEAAGVRIRGIQRRLYSALRDLGRIWLGMMDQYYTEARLYKVFGKNNIEGIAWYNPEDFRDTEFEVKVSMGSASPYSKTVIASTLETMHERQIIDGDMYLRMLPPEVFPKVTELLELTRDREEEHREMVMQQQREIIDEIVAETIQKALEAGVELSENVLHEMYRIIQEQGQDAGI